MLGRITNFSRLGIVLIFLCLGTIGFADDQVQPTQKFTGKITDPALRRLAPVNNAISDLDSWKKLWKSWRPDQQLPNVDFGSQLVLVTTVNGPNKIITNGIRLNDQGDVQFVVGSTRIGGPGFGYLLLIVPSKNIKSVNGKPISQSITPEPNQPTAPPAESVQVIITGKIRTGIIAIGGETTGVLISANGIVWELDVKQDPGMLAKIKEIGDSLARVTGTLNRVAGIEVHERWVVTVDSLSAAGASESVQPTTNARPAPSPRPNGANPKSRTSVNDDISYSPSFKSILIEITGGLANTQQSQTVLGNGKATLKSNTPGVSDQWELSPSSLAELHRFIGQTDWDSVPRLSRSGQAANPIRYTVSIATSHAVKRFSIDGPSLANQPTVQQLFKLLKKSNNKQ